MGYSTYFKGELKFTKEATGSQLAVIKSMMGQDCRDHPEWKEPDLYYIDLKITDDFSGLEWNGAEKTYGMVECVNLIIRVMKKEYPNFGLKGKMVAQGENIDDRWELVIDKNGDAIKRDILPVGKKILCPHCDEEFYFNPKEDD